MKSVRTLHALCYMASCTFVVIVSLILFYCFDIAIPFLLKIILIILIKDLFFEILGFFYPEIWLMNELAKKKKEPVVVVITGEHILGIIVAIVITIFVFCVKK